MAPDNAPSNPQKDDPKTLKDFNNYDDDQLKNLLDEAMTYRSPKDRYEKSEVFNDLLNQAEDDERNVKASRAGGSARVRYCNSSAKRHSRYGRKPNSNRNSITENMMHGGSLDNLAKDELYETVKQRTKKSVSARQREGGSLPCNVNASSSILQQTDLQFLEEARKQKRAEGDDKSVYENSLDYESESLLEHDSLAQNYQTITSTAIEVVQCSINQPTFTTKATLQVTNVDDAIPINELEQSQRTVQCTNNNNNINEKRNIYEFPGRVVSNKCVLFPSSGVKKVDENGNALQQSLATKMSKKKKTQTDKNVVVLIARDVKGHRGDIINDVEKLMEFIGGTNDDPQQTPQQQRNTNCHRNFGRSSKQLNRHLNGEDTSNRKKQRAHSSKTKESRNTKLKKCNSMGEIFTTTNMDEFAFVKDEEEEINRTDDESVVDKNVNASPNNVDVKRRSLSNVETLYTIGSIENLETAEFRVVTKKKKKTKKRRNSSANGRSGDVMGNAVQDPVVPVHAIGRQKDEERRRKSACCSVPHSERSNDSSDADSVHSLPFDVRQRRRAEPQPVTVTAAAGAAGPGGHLSYAEMAGAAAVTAPTAATPAQTTVAVHVGETTIRTDDAGANVTVVPPPPDVLNPKNFPAINTNINNSNSVSINSNNLNSKSFNSNHMTVVVDRTNCPKSVCNNNNNNNINLNMNNNNSSKNLKTVAGAGGGGGNNVNRNVKNHLSPKVCAGTVNDSSDNTIRTDLSIIQANEKDSIQYNHQMLPPNIPECRAIEKMHFLGQTTPRPLNHHPHQQHHQSYVATSQTPKTSSTTTTNQSAQSHYNNVTPSRRVTHDNNALYQSYRNTSVSSDDQSSLPPVVILSGNNGKEVSGLVFGFDVNEQLLTEDVCDSFLSRYIPPDCYTTQSHNHDEIVTFIGTAWEESINDTKVQYYAA